MCTAACKPNIGLKQYMERNGRTKRLSGTDIGVWTETTNYAYLQVFYKYLSHGTIVKQS